MRRFETVLGLVLALLIGLPGCQAPKPTELPSKPVTASTPQTPIVDARLGKVTVKPFSLSVANKHPFVKEYFPQLEQPYRESLNQFVRGPGVNTPMRCSVRHSSDRPIRPFQRVSPSWPH
ncbi:MAG: hypothetical protein HN403_12740 [Rhodospirillales bacterium]|nr:hypothetical protein [Rhodospirillales bacterium]